MALTLEGVSKPLVQGGDFGLSRHQMRCWRRGGHGRWGRRELGGRGRRAGTGGGADSTQGYRCHKAIAPPMHCGNPLRRFRGLPQRLPQFVHAGLQHAIAHGRLWPDGVEEGLFGHQLTGMCHQIDENLKGFRAQGHRLFACHRQALARSSRKGPKCHCIGYL